MSAILIYLFLITFTTGYSQEDRVSPAVIAPEIHGTCPSDERLNAQKEATQDNIGKILQSISPPCACGRPGLWTRLAHLNMSDLGTGCPPNWMLASRSTKFRGCVTSTRSGFSCDSVIFPSNDQLYSRVCGRVNAYHQGIPGAFRLSATRSPNPGLEGPYVHGLSLTHGAAGSRQHIWTFAASLSENSTRTDWICPCSNTALHWPFQVPSFVGNNYFCETGNPDPRNATIIINRLYADDPLWDGEGCGPTSTCCEFNNPPYFCTTLPQPTTDDLELRLCRGHGFTYEDVRVIFVSIYVQ